MQTTPPQDPATTLDNLDKVAVFLADAFETGHPEYIRFALDAVSRSVGMAELADAARISRGQLQQALAAGELSLDMTLAIMKVVDLHVPSRPKLRLV
jgi:probable addiction module antidote protein